ncbi:prepilin-type N-terminal cleavage/methylation domain-containing protein [Patescibacteria group bacterium]
MKCGNQQNGFTLIELLLVIGIIAMLSITAVGGYTRYRRATLLDLSVDNLVSIIDQQRGKAAQGNFGGERYTQLKDELDSPDDSGESPVYEQELAKCFGIYFDMNPDDQKMRVRSFKQKFNGNQKWDSGLKKWIYDGCDEFNPDDDTLVTFQDLQFDEEFQILEMKIIEEGNPSEELINNSLIIRFAPPDGKMEFFVDWIPYPVFIPSNSQDLKNSYIQFLSQYSQRQDDEFKRIMKYYFKTGNMTVERLPE